MSNTTACFRVGSSSRVVYYCLIISPCVNDDVTMIDATQVGSDLLSDACRDQLREIPVWLHYSTILRTSPREKKRTVEYLKNGFDFLFKCIDVEGRRGKNRNSASRCSLEGHQGKLPRFSYWSTGLLGCITWGRFGKVRYFEGLLTATTSWQIIDHFSFTNMSTS